MSFNDLFKKESQLREDAEKSKEPKSPDAKVKSDDGADEGTSGKPS